MSSQATAWHHVTEHTPDSLLVKLKNNNKSLQQGIFPERLNIVIINICLF